jgi:hypothetical protein
MDSIGFFGNSVENHVTLSNAIVDYDAAMHLMQVCDFGEFSREEITAVLIHSEKIMNLAYCYPGAGLA